MFKCKRTNSVVALSQVKGYTFYNPELDEDLYLVEVYLDASDDVLNEAKTLDIETLPLDMSHNTELMQAVKNRDFKGMLLSVDNNTRPLEYCEKLVFQVYLNSIA